MPQKRLTSADHYIYHSVTQRYNIPSQLDSIFISFTHNDQAQFQEKYRNQQISNFLAKEILSFCGVVVITLDS